MKTIFTESGKAVMVSDIDFDTLSGFTWHVNANGYAQRHITRSKGKYSKIEMHNCIMECPRGMQVDHINGDKMNNTRENLRICTPTQNRRNSKAQCGKRYKGISSNGSGFSACVRQGPRGAVVRFHCGTFSTEDAAARAYDRKAHELDPEFSRLNFADGIWSEAQLSVFRLLSPEPVSGVKGVQPNGSGWSARVKRNGINHYIGTFPTKEEAAAAREQFLATQPT